MCLQINCDFCGDGNLIDNIQQVYAELSVFWVYFRKHDNLITRLDNGIGIRYLNFSVRVVDNDFVLISSFGKTTRFLDVFRDCLLLTISDSVHRHHFSRYPYDLRIGWNDNRIIGL